MLMELLLDAFGWKTLTSKNASWPVFQKPLARMSRRALGSVLAERCENDSLVMGLQRGLGGNIVADLGQHGGCHVTDLVVTNGGYASHVADHGVVNRERCATIA